MQGASAKSVNLCLKKKKVILVVRAAYGQSAWKGVTIGGRETDFTL